MLHFMPIRTGLMCVLMIMVFGGSSSFGITGKTIAISPDRDVILGDEKSDSEGDEADDSVAQLDVHIRPIIQDGVWG